MKKSNITVYTMVNYWKRVTMDNIIFRDHSEEEECLKWAAELATDIETIIMKARQYQSEFKPRDEKFFNDEILRCEAIKKALQNDVFTTREKLESIVYFIKIGLDA